VVSNVASANFFRRTADPYGRGVASRNGLGHVLARARGSAPRNSAPQRDDLRE
jgi:hypothetical protein